MVIKIYVGVVLLISAIYLSIGECSSVQTNQNVTNTEDWQPIAFQGVRRSMELRPIQRLLQQNLTKLENLSKNTPQKAEKPESRSINEARKRPKLKYIFPGLLGK